MLPSTLVRDTSFLDGLRGLAALIVSIWHHLKMYYLDHPKDSGMVLVYRRWSGFALNGPFMVSVFFVLSGRVLSEAFYRDKSSTTIDRLRSSLIRRPLRLGLPVLGFFLSIFVIYRIPYLPNFNDNWDAFTKLHALDNAGVLQMNCHDFAGSTLVMTIIGAIDVATGHNNITCSTLWTIGEEFCGSYLIFALAAFGPRYRKSSALMMLFLIGCFSWRPSYLAQFTAGVLLCHIHHAGWTDFLFQRDTPGPSWILRIAVNVARFVVLGAMLGIGLMNWGLANRETGIDELYFKWLNWTHLGYEDYGAQDIVREVLAAGFIIIWIENCAMARKVFGSRFFAYVGKLSFGYYLWHGWIFGNIGSWILMRLEKDVETITMKEWAINVWAIALPINIILTAIVAHYFRKIVDKPSTASGRFLLRIMETPPTIAGTKSSLIRRWTATRNHPLVIRVFGLPNTLPVDYAVLSQGTDSEDSHVCEMHELDSSFSSLNEKDMEGAEVLEEVEKEDLVQITEVRIV